MAKHRSTWWKGVALAAAVATAVTAVAIAATNKPSLHAKKWMAVTGKPLAATAGAMIFLKGGNAVDAACAMIAACATMWDTLSWGGETQALIYNPVTRKVIGINALGRRADGSDTRVLPVEGHAVPARVRPARGRHARHARRDHGDARRVRESFLSPRSWPPRSTWRTATPSSSSTSTRSNASATGLLKWPESRRVLLPRPGDQPPEPGEIFRQPDLAATLRKLVETEKAALKAGKSRKDAILAAYDRFYKGDIAKEYVRGSQEVGGLHTEADLANWKVKIEEPVKVSYKGIDVYKLDFWTQGPVMLQALNILESMDLKAMGYNSTRYLHALYQAMNLAFADRDFYYGDTAYKPSTPGPGLLSKDYAKARAAKIDWAKNDANVKPGDPYPFMQATNPYADLLAKWPPPPAKKAAAAGAATEGARQQPSGARTSRRSFSPARRPSKPRTLKAGSSRSLRAAAGSPRSSPARPASA